MKDRFFLILFVFLLAFPLSAYSQIPADEELTDEDLADLTDEEIEKLIREEDAAEEAKKPQPKEAVPDKKEEAIKVDEEGLPIEPKKEAKKKKDEKRDIKNLPEMLLLKADCFIMGDKSKEGHYDERPAHKVCIDDFFIATTEVTQALWEEVVEANPSVFRSPDKPVEFVNWTETQLFIRKLNWLTGRFFRLPTEAEWEYAAKGKGKDEKWPGTNDEDDLDDYSWNAYNADNTTHPVRQKKPNAFGLYDMAGNVWEWVHDYYDMEYYKISPEKDPEGAEFSLWMGLRGGSFMDEPDKLRSTSRYGNVPKRKAFNIGFRLAE
ncbi:MAG: formylglycine-generating enzyme family protein [Deltaproteobacteria bacterium]|nr:formylglycine-generating enzyme family protein [Deltaproteobacteria bacterium]